ncbi:hypothetical protein P3T76_011080 [Phytophthora citrophthora]|uniref:Uncharacterized protein n=1 Tax=Phytophthora citrophthora TaxID=4793 RepID=A0AAD9G9S6_9STRA|nr:hypothetical protein P3T76_011080 [Phytophthora citrophthora]
MRLTGRGSFFIAAAVMAAAVEMGRYAVDAQPISVECSDSKNATLTLGDVAKYTCGNNQDNSSMVPIVNTEVQVDVSVETMELQLEGAQNLVDL